jgi:hypothetical protein
MRRLPRFEDIPREAGAPSFSIDSLPKEGVDCRWRSCGNSVGRGGRNSSDRVYVAISPRVITVSHNSPLVRGGPSALRGKPFESFPQIHSNHHNNKPYRSKIYESPLLL